MIFRKHTSLVRKFLGNLKRRRYGWKNKSVKLLKFFYLLALWPFEMVGDVLFWKKRKNKEVVTVLKRVLVIKTDQFGDVLFSTFLIPILKKKFPDCEIEYLVNEKTRILFEKNTQISNVFTWEDPFLFLRPAREKRRDWSLMDAMRKNKKTKKILKERKYDAIINARAYPPSSNILWRMMGKKLIAFDISEQSFLADYWAEYDLSEEEWKNYLNLLKPFNIDLSEASFDPRFFNIAEKNPFEEKRGKYVVISPVSFDKDREWGIEKWQKLFSHLSSIGYDIVLTGIPDHRDYLQSLTTKETEGVFILVDTSIPELGRLIKDADFFLGIESFPLHLAIALEKRVGCFVNPRVYYLKGVSRPGFVHDARSMIPILDSICFLDVDFSAEKVIKIVSERLNR